MNVETQTDRRDLISKEVVKTSQGIVMEVVHFPAPLKGPERKKQNDE